MKDSILKVENLSVCYHWDNKSFQAVNNVSFNLNRDESLGIIGESGSGKTSLAMAILGLFKKSTQIDGQIYYKNIDLTKLSEKEQNLYRWRKIAIVFQNSLDVLNPVMTIHEQILECLYQHTTLTPQEANKKVLRLLKLVGLETKWNNYYPHQLSGGMRQRILIAMALSCNPELLIIDEPTSALDAVAKNEIIELLARLHQEQRFALIVISHEMQTITSNPIHHSQSSF